MRETSADRSASVRGHVAVSERLWHPLDAAAREAFVRGARRFVGRDRTSPFSVDDVHRVACALELNGVLFLEKGAETRHASVLLGLDEELVRLYDPRSGVKFRRCDDAELGMYCRLVGPVRDEFREHEREAAPGCSSDVWVRYARRGALLRRFLGRHRAFGRLLPADPARGFEWVKLPPIQLAMGPADCAPLSLYVIALLDSEARHGARLATMRSFRVAPAARSRLGGAQENTRSRENDMSIQIFVTGGTFDKEYEERDGSLVFKDTHVQEVLRLGRSRLPVDVRTLMLVDSLEMTDAERDIIVENCRRCRRDRIVITHGTDSMELTARALGRAGTGKTIVLTGALVPYKLGSSDGLFNLGSALAFAQTLPHGVYVAMNGKCFSWERVQKNRATGEFEELAPVSQAAGGA